MAGSLSKQESELTDYCTVSYLWSILYHVMEYQLSYYRIEQNFGGQKFWRNCDFETLAEKNFTESKAFLHFHYSARTIALKSVNYEIPYIACMRSIERSRALKITADQGRDLY